jgi:DNA-binding response OmpR family regulator
VHVSRIRQKLEVGGEPRLISTVRGIGYRFLAESKEELGESP